MCVDEVPAIRAGCNDILRLPIESILELHEPQASQEFAFEAGVGRPMPVAVRIHDQLVRTQALPDTVVRFEALVMAGIVHGLPRRSIKRLIAAVDPERNE